ncbi:hypothetical protein SpCBS45565_g03000 [Spizellomyces sp. 'palustris']|nr:hypothetical protein SpCBS45565_g03000 [Spizellomyces sp. 'palustris']
MDKPSFASSFWGDNDKGLEVLMGRMRQGKHVSEEVHAMLKERATIEEEYGRRMHKLAKTFSPKEEIGTLRDSLDIVKNELEKSAKSHIDLAQEIRVKLEKPLGDFIGTQSGIRKNHNAIVEKHQKAKAAQVAAVMKSKERYEAKCAETTQLSQIRADPASKEAEKIKMKLQKVQSQAKQADVDYVAGVEKLTEIHRRWVDDFRTACTECQKLEEDRFHFLRGNIWNYANFISGVCVSDDEACERVRVSLEACDFEKDLALFLDRNTTGSVIPQPLQYINYYTGTQENSVSGRRKSTTSNDLPASLPMYNPSQDDLGSAHTLGSGPGGYNDPTTNRRDSASSKGSAAFSGAIGQQVLNGMPHHQQQRSGSNAPPAGADATFQYDPYDVPESMPVLFSVRVLYDYQAQAPEELTVGKGQLIPVIATHDDGWWEGLGSEGGQRRKGLFPSNFTETVR